MKTQLRNLIPSSFEFIGGIVLTFVIILLTNSKQLLNYYGLQSSDQLIKSSAGNVLTDGLKVIDSFSLTNSVVTFLIWAVVGMICFGIVEAIGNGYQQLRLEQAVGSNRYVHPMSFSKAKFWRSVAFDTFTLLFSFAMLTITGLFVTLFTIPVGLAYSRVYLFDTAPSNIIYILLGLLILFVSVMLFVVAARLVLLRRKIFRS